jgi:hypothetical protein
MTTSDELIQTSLALEHASRSLARDTLWSPENLTPAVIGTVLGNIASVAEIFPQILEQLSRSLEEALSEQFLQIEGRLVAVAVVLDGAAGAGDNESAGQYA